MSNMVSESSSYKQSKIRSVPTSLFDLPEDILVTICSKVACTSLDDIRSLELVSKSLNNICNNKYVVQQLPLHQIPFSPFNHNLETFNKFMKRCRKDGNLEAIYRKGLKVYFDQDSDQTARLKGLKYMAKAAKEGNPEAKYVYGLILLCLGGESINAALKIMAPLIKPMMSNTLIEVERLRLKNVNNLYWYVRTSGHMKYLKSIYTRAKCNCDGKTELQMYNRGWCPYGSNHDMATSYACHICMWHPQVKLFFFFS